MASLNIVLKKQYTLFWTSFTVVFGLLLFGSLYFGWLDLFSRDPTFKPAGSSSTVFAVNLILLYFVTLFSNLIVIFYGQFTKTAWPNSYGVNYTFFAGSGVATFSFSEIRSFWSASKRTESLGTTKVLPGHDCTMSRSVRTTRIKNMGRMIGQGAKQTILNNCKMVFCTSWIRKYFFPVT